MTELPDPNAAACGEWLTPCPLPSSGSQLAACDLVRLASLTEDLFCVLDRDGRFVRLNPAWERLIGQDLAGFVGRPMTEVVHPAEEDATRAALADLPPGSRRAHLHNRLRRADGEWAWLLWSLVADERDDLVYAVARDVTGLQLEQAHRREAEAKAEDAETLLEAIRHVQRLAIAECEPAPLFDYMLSQVLSVTHSEYGFIGEVHTDESGPYLKTHAITNIAWDDDTRRFFEEKAPQGLEFRNLSTLFGAVITGGEPLIANDPASDPRAGGLPPGHPAMHAFLGVPLADGDGMVGMLGVANREGGYDDSVVRFLEPLTSSAARLIRTYQARRERRRAADELQRSEQRWRRSIEMAAHPIVLWDDQRNITYANRALLNLYGGGRDELVGRCLDDLIADGDPGHAEALERMRSSGWRHRLSQLRRAQGKPVPVELQAVDLGDGIYQGMIVDMSEWVEVEARLQQASQRDNLTGLLNRAAIEEHAEVEIHRARRRATPVSLLLVDVDHFKAINDRHGHLVGDAALRRLAQVVQASVRPYDWVGRWGGEEILVVLPETTEEQALVAGERIRAAVAAGPLETNTSAPLQVTVSVGVAGVGVGYVPSLRSLFGRVDRSLIMAKEQGRNRVVVYQDSTMFRRFPAALPGRPREASQEPR
jgi:diguanylate cyclase (GGDEF)-like protein/PAS domain S-box-containing protein